jgi:putative FmdB family regulatory protein
MPIYEFKCTSCEHVFETVIWNSDAEMSIECPACGRTDLQRLLSSFSKCGFGTSDASSCAPAGSKFK